jgi:murein DD-endopeptidase MepM/ murein hydrolase activator NlpD
VRAFFILGAPVVAVLALTFGLVIVLVPANPSVAEPDCVVQTPGAITDMHLDQEQLRVARVILDVARELNVPPRGWVVALAAGMQESGLRPLDYGDRDSLGVFQQRTAWGTVAQRLDPRASASMFFTGGHAGQRGLLNIPGWANLSVTAAAQAVQVSAHPDAYATWENLAVRLVDQLGGVDAGCEPAGLWVSPLGRASYVLTAGFGECGAHWAACHTGQDFAAPTGAPVIAASTGVVTYAGWDGAYGNAVHLLHVGGVSTWYAHLSRIDTTRGARLDAGDLVGLVGATGNTTGPHLHLEVRHGSSAATAGTPVDPLAWLRSHHAL